MIEVSKTAELSSPPRKRRWKARLIGLECVVAAATIMLLASMPKQEPVKVWFVRATNEAGVKKFVFEGTNGMTREIGVFAYLITGGGRPGGDLSTSVGRARTNFQFALKAPPKDVPYVVEWYFRGIPLTRWQKLREVVQVFFTTHHMPTLADRLAFSPEMRTIASSEIDE